MPNQTHRAPPRYKIPGFFSILLDHRSIRSREPAREMTFEATVSDPIRWWFVSAYLKASGYQPEERLIRKLGKSA
jgi:hypothetical protein